jgi:hypothetical protein
MRKLFQKVMKDKLNLQGKRGQAALEFLMTYGWAFLVMIAVIAGIVALDPLGAAQTNIQTCQLSPPLACNGDAMLLSADGGSGNLSIRIENIGRESITFENISVSDTNGVASCTLPSPADLSPGDYVDVDCGDLSGVIAGDFVAEDSYNMDLEVTLYNTRIGNNYARQIDGTVRATAQ